MKTQLDGRSGSRFASSINAVTRWIPLILFSGCALITEPREATATSAETESKAETSVNTDHELLRLSTANAREDFEVAKRNGDVYFLALKGITLDVPGVELGEEPYLKRVKVKVIAGTSDVLGGAQTRHVRRKVRLYAETYNRLVIKFLRQKEEQRRG